MKNYVDVIGIDRDLCIVQGSLPNDTDPAVIEATSTFDGNGTWLLKNLTITCQNMRYAVHSDSSIDVANNQDMINRYDNCYIEHKGNAGARTAQSPTVIWTSELAIGSGTKSGQKIEIKNCEIKGVVAGFSVHNNTGFTKAANVEIYDSKLISPTTTGYSFRVQSLGSGFNDKILLSNCMLEGRIRHDDDPWGGAGGLSTHVEWDITLAGCTTVFYEISTDIAADAFTTPLDIDNDKNFFNTSGSTILRGMAVSHNTAPSNIKAMPYTESQDRFVGIALEDIAATTGYGRVRTLGQFSPTFLNREDAAAIALGGQFGLSRTTAGSFLYAATPALLSALATTRIKYDKPQRGVAFPTITAAGTVGARTINEFAGTVNFAASAASLVVTNNRVTTSSIIICTVGTNDATMKSALAVATAGSFTIFPNAVPAAETRVNFLVTN